MRVFRNLSQTQLIFIGMFSGVIIGFSFPEVGIKLEVVGVIFIRLVKSIIIPIIFATLVVGIAKHSDLKAVGRMGIDTVMDMGLTAINVTGKCLATVVIAKWEGIFRNDTAAIPEEMIAETGEALEISDAPSSTLGEPT